MKRSYCTQTGGRFAAYVVFILAAVAGIFIHPAYATPPRPVINGFSPVSGAPGATVTITGANFVDVREVRFNQTIALINSVSTQQIIVTVPLEAASGPITIITGRWTVTSAAHFQVAPVITGFTPSTARIGANVVIEGSNFTGATTVKFGGRNATFAVAAPTQINATVPSGAISGPITVTAAAGTATSGENFVVAGTEPFISSFSPTNGAPGTIVVIEGRNFAGTTAVKFNGTNANFSVSAPTQISTIVPPAVTTGRITVTTPSGTSTSSIPFFASSGPVITDFTPAAGIAGTVVVLEGFNFENTRTVRFNTNTARFTVTSPTQISATVPAGAKTGPITVITPKGTNVSSKTFLVSLAPAITGFSPESGPVGTAVTIEGYNFDDALEVKFGTNQAPFGVTSATQIRAIVPLGAVNSLISVKTPLGNATNTTPFVVIGSAPVIKNFSPAAGKAGDKVIIDGVNFIGTTNVDFSGTRAAFTVTSPTQITCYVPTNAASGFIKIANLSGTNLSTNRFIIAPHINSFSPTNGIAGSVVTIRGTNFSDATAVRFNGANASFSIDSAGQITATVPTNAVNGTISVATPAGVISSINAFTALPQLISFSPLAGPAGTQVTLRGTHIGDAVSVEFGNVQAAFTSVSPYELRAIVPPQAQTSRITIRTPTGATTSTNNFIVSQSASLVVHIKASTNTLTLGSNLTFTVTVTNAGPSTASSVAVSNHFPASTLFVNGTASRGNFQQDGALLKWNFSNLASGTNATLVFTVTPTSVGSITNLAIASAPELDPNMDDNRAAQIVEVLTGPATLSIEVKTNQVLITWPTNAVGFSLESSMQLGSRGGWTAVTNSSSTVQGKKQVSLPVSSAAKYFRLRK